MIKNPWKIRNRVVFFSLIKMCAKNLTANTILKDKLETFLKVRNITTTTNYFKIVLEVLASAKRQN